MILLININNCQYNCFITRQLDCSKDSIDPGIVSDVVELNISHPIEDKDIHCKK